jgi:hypothetical protein
MMNLRKQGKSTELKSNPGYPALLVDVNGR